MTSLLEAAERFSDIVHATTDWHARTVCDGWDAAAVVDHVVDSQRDFMVRHGMELGDRPIGSAPAVWAAHLDAVRPFATDDLFTSRAVEGFFGPTTLGATLDGFYGFDLMVHGWDIGSSNGRPPRFTEREMDALETALAGFGEHAYDEGVFERPVETPEGADRQTRLLARMGRRVPTGLEH